ncbi:MAG: zinc metallopeptidase [Acidobacteria bacterium]|nr:zinc metallopeptidase [Acidobacteriota bacterium]
MRWQRGTSDEDIEDRRGSSGGGGGFRVGGGGGGLRLGLGGLIIVGILSLVFKQNFFALLGDLPADTSVSTSAPSGPPAATSAEETERYEFVKFVVNDVQDTWTAVLPKEANVRYDRAKLVLFRDAVESACGFAESASGPFYCPGDQKVYIDLAFYDELKSRFGASGDFAQAYVIAHEIGHHLQNLLGIEQQVRRAQQRRSGQENDLAVRMELQADCFAGVWGHSTGQRNILEKGDVEEGLNAAAAIGDDRIQRMSGRGVHPEKFTHGSSAQRVEWFRRGLESGSVNACDTFAAR